MTLSTSFPAAPLLLHPFLLLQRFTQALPPDCPTLCLSSMLVCTNPQGFHKKREGKGVLKSKRMGPSPFLSLVTSSRFLTQLCAGSLGCHEQSSPCCIPCRQQSTAGKGSTCRKIPSKETDPFQHKNGILNIKAKGLMLLEMLHPPGQGVSPKAAPAGTTQFPSSLSQLTPSPSSQECLRMPPAPQQLSLLMVAFGRIASLLLQVFREQEEV